MTFHFICLRIILALSLILVLLFSKTEPSYSLNIDSQVDDITSNSKVYLSSQLKYLLRSKSLDHQKINYFRLPNSTSLSEIPADPRNPLTSDKVRLGQLLFHETALTINPVNPKHWQQGSCSSCHFAQAGFRSNLLQGLGVGGLGFNKFRHRDPEVLSTEIDKLKILVPSVLNSAYQEIKPWDGRAGITGPNRGEPQIQKFDINRLKLQGLEAQSIEGLEFHRMGTAQIATIQEYKELFAKAFPTDPDLGSGVDSRVKAGLAISAYERTLLANQAPFQRWLRGDESAMSLEELRGAGTFFRSSCVQCHTGPNLAKTEFHAIGFADHPREVSGLNLGRGVVTQSSKDDFKFKVPQLYNLVDSSPYGHGGSFKTIREIVEYFDKGVPQSLVAQYSNNLSIWFKPLNLSEKEIDDLTTFLETGLRDPNLIRYVPEKLPSGLCFPNNDPESRKQLGCE